MRYDSCQFVSRISKDRVSIRELAGMPHRCPTVHLIKGPYPAKQSRKCDMGNNITLLLKLRARTRAHLLVETSELDLTVSCSDWLINRPGLWRSPRPDEDRI